MIQKIERRRTVRLKRSALLKNKLDSIDRLAIKFAESQDEYSQALSLIYEEYVKSGYIPNPVPDGKVFSIYYLLPETEVFIAKSHLTSISTLTQIIDSKLFGLPMDSIYKEELQLLREEGRLIAEIGGLATEKYFRWQNLFMFLMQIMYWHTHYKEVDDLCITVNPKHVRFFKAVFLFEEFGPEKQYPKVSAPAVLLRLNMDDINSKMKRVYNNLDFESNLYEYFHRMNGNQLEDSVETLKDKETVVKKQPRLDIVTAKALTRADKRIFKGITTEQKDYLLKLYPGLQL